MPDYTELTGLAWLTYVPLPKGNSTIDEYRRGGSGGSAGVSKGSGPAGGVVVVIDEVGDRLVSFLTADVR